MKKNGEFAGVDEKYIPEDEKYVDESLLGNREQTKKSVTKVAKGIGIGYLCFIGIIFLLVIGVFIFCFSMFSKSMSIFDDTKAQIGSVVQDMNKEDSIITNGKNQILSEANKQKAESFNSDFERYIGTKQKMSIETLLDKVVTNNKKEKEHVITVKYNETVSNKTEDIVKLKHSLETGKMYEVLLDYDENGYVNQVNIIDI